MMLITKYCGSILSLKGSLGILTVKIQENLHQPLNNKSHNPNPEALTSNSNTQKLKLQAPKPETPLNLRDQNL